jgi:hypothetical protein
MWLDALVIDLLRPSGALHTIVVKPKAYGDYAGRYVGLDAHPTSRTLAVMGPSGKRLQLIRGVGQT